MSPGIIIRVRSAEDAVVAADNIRECVACEDWPGVAKWSKELHTWAKKQPPPAT